MLDSSNNQNIPILKWFQNAEKSHDNQEILVLTTANENENNIWKDKIALLNIPHLLITTSKDLTIENLENEEYRNILLVEKYEISLVLLMKLKDAGKKLLFANTRSLEPQFNYINENILIPEYGKYLQIYKVTADENFIGERLTLVTPNVLYYIEYVIRTFMNTLTFNDVYFNKSDIQYALYGNKKGLTRDVILNDIKYLENESCLTSRLGVFIYKICTWDFEATNVTIGKYYAASFGKSKHLNNKKYAIVNTKGYEIPNFITDRVMQTKIDIARKLYNLQMLNIDIISNVVGLDVSTFRNEIC